MTSRGIYLDIFESEYFLFVYDNFNNQYKLYFTSENKMNKFKEIYKDYINEELLKFKRHYIATINTFPFIYSLYKKYEKRGFFICKWNEKLNKFMPLIEEEIINGYTL